MRQMLPETRYDWFLLTLRLLTGVLFLASGAAKAFLGAGPAGFAESVSHYHILMDPWNLVVAYLLPWLEMVAGGCLLGGFLVRGALVIVEGMTAMFAFGIGQAWFRKLEISCGCFGESEVKSNYPMHLAGLALLGAVLALLHCRELKEKKPLKA
jgi:putative oxidoreductase